MRLAFIVLLSFLCVGRVGDALAAPMDFDGDGISDLTSYAVSGKQLKWTTRLSSSQQELDHGVFGASDDTPTPGSWLGPTAQIGVVSLEKNALVWSVLNNGNIESKSFGTKGDLAVSGADFNGNGVADAAVVRLKDGKAVWQILLDPFTDAASQPRTVNFGAAGDRVFFARGDSSPADWIGFMRKGGGRNSQARLKNIITGEVRTLTRLPAFASDGDRPRVFPVNQQNGPDLFAFHVAKSNSTSVRVFSQAGVEVGNVLFDGSGEAFFGELNEDPGNEIAFQADGDASAFNPNLSMGRQVPALSGTLVDHVAFKTVGGVTSSGGASGGSGNPVVVPAGGVAQCNSLVSWPGSYIYKTVGSNHFTDVRRNTIGLVMKVGAPNANVTSCVEVLASNGRVITSLGLYGRGAGWAARYYSGIGCGAATPVNGNAVASLARSVSGSSQIIFKLGNTCYGPIEATRCLNSSSC